MEKEMIQIEASVLSADYARLGEYALQAQDAGVEAVQIDVMDGRFVPNITFGPGVVRALRSVLSLPLDVHLMIVEPERYLSAFADAGADRLIIHQEATRHPHRALQVIREAGIEAGVSINPGTPLSALEELLDLVDLIQIMTVNPGFGGQELIPSQLVKIRRLRELLAGRRLNIPIAVDGGIDTITAPQVVGAGATVIVAGSSIYNDHASVSENVQNLRATAQSGLYGTV
jgi:ribulose-phosphate 3-epimerase